jgi:hypothetical protein
MPEEVGTREKVVYQIRPRKDKRGFDLISDARAIPSNLRVFMIKCLVISLASMFIAVEPSFAADDSVTVFEALLRRATNNTNIATPAYFNNYLKKWAKRRFHISDAKMDVRRTDSLVTPIVGVVTFRLRTEQTPLYATKAQAIAASTFAEDMTTDYDITLRYGYRDGAWSFTDGTSTMLKDPFGIGPQTITTAKAKNEPDAIPFAALTTWIDDANVKPK